MRLSNKEKVIKPGFPLIFIDIFQCLNNSLGTLVKS